MTDQGSLASKPPQPLPQMESFPLLQADALVAQAEEQVYRDTIISSARRSAMQGLRPEHGPVKLQMHHPGGSSTCKSGYAYRLNTTVMAVLHRGYVHPGTRCEVTIQALENLSILVRATVVQCHHLSGLIHDSIVEFEERQDLRMFVKWTPELAALVAETEKPRKLRGRVLHIEPSQSERALLASRLKGTELQVTAVPDAPEAYDEAKRTGNWQLIISELQVRETAVTELSEKLRSLGEHGPLLVLTSERGPRRQAMVDRCEAAGVLDKPYSADALLALIGSLLPTGDTEGYTFCPSGRVCSTLRETDSARQLVAGYIEECQVQRPELERAIAHGDVPNARAVCLWLAGSAHAFGFAAVADQASQAVTEIDASGSTEEAGRTLNTLVAMLGRLSVCGPHGCCQDHAA